MNWSFFVWKVLFQINSAHFYLIVGIKVSFPFCTKLIMRFGKICRRRHIILERSNRVVWKSSSWCNLVQTHFSSISLINCILTKLYRYVVRMLYFVDCLKPSNNVSMDLLLFLNRFMCRMWKAKPVEVDSGERITTRSKRLKENLQACMQGASTHEIGFCIMRWSFCLPQWENNYFMYVYVCLKQFSQPNRFNSSVFITNLFVIFFIITV